MKKIIFIFFILFVNLAHSQSNKDILNKLNEIEDEKLFNSLLNNLKSNSSNAYSLNTDNSLKYMGTHNDSRYFIDNQKSYKKDGIVAFILITNSITTIKSKVGFYYKSSIMNVFPDCQKDQMMSYDINFFSGSDLQGELVFKVEQMKFDEITMKNNSVLKQIKKYVCR